MPAGSARLVQSVSARSITYVAGSGRVSNAHAGAGNGDPGVRALLDQHHQESRDAMYTALVTARTHGQLATEADPAAAADLPALLACGLNLRSRAGADAQALKRTVTAALDFTGRRPAA
ncbi:hypothetical protein GCM10010300_25050 [Streptomyces olivaceoviridis]|nr:hypothetical protein GCM10010300_25050 [Streptomyces olivaceoviridis]